MSEPKSRHGQIKHALLQDSRNQGMALNDVYNRFFRELFLGELGTRDQGWVLKGGTNLYCRIDQARHTRDLDLYRQDDPTSYREAAKDLVEIMDGTKIGPYTFTLTAPKAASLQGTIDSIQLTAHVHQGVSKLAHFHIDVSGDLQVPAVTEKLTVERSDSLDLAFVGREYTIRSYPIENQLADKVCAMYEVHGSRVSTRYRDLYDIALITLSLDVNGTEFSTALRVQEKIRGLVLPALLHLPGAEWEAGYRGLGKNSPRLRKEITDVHDALRIAGALVDPVLAAAANEFSGTWSPGNGTWA
ncbi:nucleotidyl transferase AbiEii/AbiGii toxin family protein [Corynebacterium sp. A21]|uniref:nucleotidyl transferase AbiEii/AbiGii toxin family protein n=1 Tax=Corynebacterium sp. A21 TaxID=3457318 RepID=UPI003FD2DF1C